jgi:accessory colonization factor AcfC
VQDAEAFVDELTVGQDTAASGLISDAYRAMSRRERIAALRQTIDVVFVRKTGGPTGRNTPPLDSWRVWVLWRGQAPSYLPSANRPSAPRR